MADSYGYFLNRVMQPVASDQGASGYFSAPEDNLDPRLFDGDHLKAEVRERLLAPLYDFWATRYNRAQDWSTAWIAGSGISYQWAAARGGLGDLDVLIGIDYDEFYSANPNVGRMSAKDLSAIFNQEFHAELWPKTAETMINGGGFEVTYYVNPNSTDIRNINPYAAYNLSDDEWTVRPPEGEDFNHAQSFYDYADREVNQATQLVAQYNTLAEQAKTMAPGSPGWHNAMRQAEVLVSKASAMYDDIHLGRKQAFAPGGSGYGDYYNFRWQYHKKNGTAQALNGVAKAHKAAQEEYSNTVYGGAISGADVALRRAVQASRGVR